MRLMTKPKVGDIFEVPTAKGLVYAQYTHHHAEMGGLIRVFDRVFSERPKNFENLVHGQVRFSTFFPVTATIKRGIFKIVGHEEIAPLNKVFPVFRGGLGDPQTKKVTAWWFWDGEKEWKVGEITAEQRKMPIQEILNDRMLTHRIESGWTPETDRE